MSARKKPMSLRELENEVRRSARYYEPRGDIQRLARFAVEFERAIYDGRIDPDAIPRDVLMILVGR